VFLAWHLGALAATSISTRKVGIVNCHGLLQLAVVIPSVCLSLLAWKTISVERICVCRGYTAVERLQQYHDAKMNYSREDQSGHLREAAAKFLRVVIQTQS